MIIYRLHVCIILLLVNFSSGQKTFVTRAAHSIHQMAVHHTHNLARDLRIAFGVYLIPRASSDNQHVVFCKRGDQSPLLNGGSGNVSISKSPATATHSSSAPKATATSPWKLSTSYQGNNFFDAWDFFTGSDPTNGVVDYVDEQTAQSNGLLEVNSKGNAVMRVETTENVSGNRQSIRITTQKSFNGGLVIMDSVHMPTGCGTWPAFWTNGPDWPNGGEIDIVEGVNDYTNNQATIHTDVGCTLPSSNSTTLEISGNVVGGTDCAALTTGNQGCGIRASTNNSFGVGFNANGGGVYAMKWDTTGVAVYFFSRGSVPADISAGVPEPDSWGNAALARWPAASCAPFEFFKNHNPIFDTTLCGDWAGAVWSDSGSPGQEQSCAERTGFSTCQAFVQASGSAMSEAYWEVTSVKIYQLQS
jgi:hypothetical protein